MRTLALLAVCVLHGADLQQLYNAQDWFAMRAAAPSDRFYKGVVAAAFHNVKDAERLLRPIDDIESHLMLVGVYMRQSRPSKALEHLRAARKLKPDRPDIANAMQLFGALAQWPDQKTTANKPSRIRYTTHEGNIYVPVTVNGRQVEWIFDTGANFSMVSESEAKRLGMDIGGSGGKMDDATGNPLSIRVAHARDVVFGGLRLQHVTFILARDDQEPFRDLPPGRRGAIGLPVLLAAGSLSWDSTGSVDIGSRRLQGQPNLAFYNGMPIARVEYGGRPVPMHLDTGAERTHLWPKFASEFPLDGATKQTTSFSGVGQRVSVDSLKVAELTLRIGGRDVLFSPATVLLKQDGGGAKHYYGNLGVDLLQKSKRCTIDFGAMRMELE